MNSNRPLAVVTGASSGIGFELARLCAQNNYDLIIAADESEVYVKAATLKETGSEVRPIECDLSTQEGFEQVRAAIEDDGRPVAALFANAGRGLGHAFLDQDIDDALDVVHTNIDGTLRLVHDVARDMRDRHEGRILVTGSIAGHIPGSYQAVYNGSKAFVDSFAAALSNELKDTGVTVTCLMPGPTDTNFFERADLLDTKVGQEEKDDPAEVAKTGFDAMMKGETSVVHGLKNKVQVAMAGVTPDTVLAEQHRKLAAPTKPKARKSTKRAKVDSSIDPSEEITTNSLHERH
jgi:short-subunit dehydrogenase